jgi:outer membrane protein TolC
VEDTAPGPSPTVESSYQLALGYQPALLNARAALEVAKLDLEFAEDDLKPSVDLGLDLGFNGSDRTGSRAWSDAFGEDRGSWTAGLTVTYPLGRVAEKARFSQSRAAMNRQGLLVQQLEQDILVQVRDAVRDVETSRESVSIAALAVELSDQQYEAERERFTSGLSTGRRVLEAQTDLESARLAELQARLNLRTAMTALRRIEGSSLRYYGITLTHSK